MFTCSNDVPSNWNNSNSDTTCYNFQKRRNVAFGETTQSPQRIDKQCEMKVDKDFTMFVATFKGNYSRIKRNIEELRNQYVSVC